jgi:hypothetical protein
MLEQLSRLFLLVLSYIVLSSLVYILPAIAVSVIAWDKSVYLVCVTNPLYAVFFGLLSLIGVGAYMDSLAERGLI